MQVGDLVRIIKASDPHHPCINRLVLVMGICVDFSEIVYILNPFTGQQEIFSNSYLEAV